MRPRHALVNGYLWLLLYPWVGSVTIVLWMRWATSARLMSLGLPRNRETMFSNWWVLVLRADVALRECERTGFCVCVTPKRP